MTDTKNTEEKLEGLPDAMGPQQISPTRQYFTREIESAIRDMSEQEMFNHLLNLEQHPAWIAILKYNQIRLQYSQSAVLSGDPVREPTQIARNQGVMLGLSDLQNAVILLKFEKLQAAQEADEGAQG